MSWAKFHAESERLAIAAQFALRTGDVVLSNDLYNQAALKEREALEVLDDSKLRTKGITLVSAVSLWFKAGEYESAERLAHAALAQEQLPDFSREQLRNLIQAIWTESVKKEAKVTFMPGQVLVSVKGGEVVTGGAPLDLIVDKVQTIQSIFYRAIEHLQGVSHRRAGPPSKDLQDSCRPWLFQSAPGSYQFSVAIQQPVQTDFFKEGVEPSRVAQHFLEIISATTDGEGERLANLVEDKDYRTTFLKLARNLAPTGKTFEQIDLRGSGEIKSLSLNTESRNTINSQLKKITYLPPDQALPAEELFGTLRAVDLDKNWLDITVDGASIHIEGLQDAVDDVIGPMVNRSVIVKAVRSTSKRSKYKFIDIELAD